MNESIGIDLGTYNSAAAVAIGRDKVIMIRSRYGRTVYGSGKNFPSFVLFDYNGKKQMVGILAKANRRDPRILIWGVKRLVGLSYDEAQRRGELDRFHYNIEKGPGGGILIRVGEERFTPSHILEFILNEIKEDAENDKINPEAGKNIENAVISVPAYFDATRTGLIKEAAENVGFKKVETIAEPTAAAIQYAAHGLDIKEKSYILTFDIGAGTLDITVMLILSENGEIIPGEVCTSGNESLGGIDIDDLLAEYIMSKYNLNFENDLDLKATFTEEVEKAKVNLSTLDNVPLSLPDQRNIFLSQKEIEYVLNSKKSSPQDNESFLEKCRGPIRVALNSAGIDAGDLNHVLFVGGKG
jgi:molecular chaperone DnaK